MAVSMNESKEDTELERVGEREKDGRHSSWRRVEGNKRRLGGTNGESNLSL